MKNVFLSRLSFFPSLASALCVLLFIGVLLPGTGCSKEERIPAHIVPKEKMVSILTDVHELEAKVNLLRLENDSSTRLFKEQQALIFEKHNVNDSVYNLSFTYYMRRVDLMNKIYEAVVDSLSLRKNVERRDEAKEETEDPI